MATASTLQYTKLDIIVQKGDTLDSNNAVFTVVDNAGANIDLTGYDSSTLVVTDIHGNAIITFDTADSSLILADGSFQLAKTATLMDALTAGAFRFLHKVIASTTEYTIGKGQFIVRGK